MPRGVADFGGLEGEGQIRGDKINALNASLRHEEEVQRHIESSNLAPHEVALYILQHGSSGQKISMLGHLNRTLRDCSATHTTQIIGDLNEAMWTQDTELQVAAPAALIGILGMLNESQIVLLLTGTRTMLEVKTETIRKEWSALALEICGALPAAVLTREMIPLALKKTEHSEPHDQRVFGCTLIGRLCRKLDAETICNSILRKAMFLCQDTDTNVRVTMCAQLSEVARAIGLQLTKERITRELFELLVDEEKLVSRAAFTALIDLVEFFDAPYRREHFYPIIKSYISSPPEEVLSLLTEEFGRFLWKIKSDVQTQEDVTLFANFFRQSAQKPDPDVRRMCAFNLPAVVASLPVSVYPTMLAQTTRSLAVDSSSAVRRAIAAGFHELCALLGDKAAFFLKEPFLALVQDPALDVRGHVMQHLTTMLDVFSAQLRGDDREAFFASAAPHIASYEAIVRKDWRRVTVLFNSFLRFHVYFPAALLHDRFLPILYHHLVSGSSAVKDQCATLVILFARSMLTGSGGSGMLTASSSMTMNGGGSGRIASSSAVLPPSPPACGPAGTSGGSSSINFVVEAFGKILSEFGRSPSCFNRATFTLLFKHAAAKFSRRFVRDRLLEALMDLSKDPVANVRMQLARVLPVARRVLKAPVDPEHVAMYNAALKRMQSDADPDVMIELRQVAPLIDDLEREFAQQAALRSTNLPDDLLDRQLDEQEGPLLELAKEQEKIERRAKLRELLRADTNPAGTAVGVADGPGTRPAPKRGGAAKTDGYNVPSASAAASSAGVGPTASPTVGIPRTRGASQSHGQPSPVASAGRGTTSMSSTVTAGSRAGGSTVLPAIGRGNR